MLNLESLKKNVKFEKKDFYTQVVDNVRFMNLFFWYII